MEQDRSIATFIKKSYQKQAGLLEPWHELIWFMSITTSFHLTLTAAPQKVAWTSVQPAESGTSLKQQSSVLCLTWQPHVTLFSSSALCLCCQNTVMWIYSPCYYNRYELLLDSNNENEICSIIHVSVLSIFFVSCLYMKSENVWFCPYYYAIRTTVYSSHLWFILFVRGLFYQNTDFLPWTLEDNDIHSLIEIRLRWMNLHDPSWLDFSHSNASSNIQGKLQLIGTCIGDP